jgi:hypothetical protein
MSVAEQAHKLRKTISMGPGAEFVSRELSMTTACPELPPVTKRWPSIQFAVAVVGSEAMHFYYRRLSENGSG